MKAFFAGLVVLLVYGCKVPPAPGTSYYIPAEFEKQDAIWLSWKEKGFLGGEPFYTTILEAVKEIHKTTPVTILYGPEPGFTREQMQQKILAEFRTRGIDTSRIRLFFNEKSFGAIQDPGPIFLKDQDGDLAVADFRYVHPDPRSEHIDRNVAKQMNLPLVSSEMISEGGAWQTNGQGTMLLVEAVELDRNRSMTKKQIEKEYQRVLGVKKIIWLKKGLKDEEWGLLDDGRYGIGTGGHIDEFCRFVNHTTVLLTAIDPRDTVNNKIQRASYERMEENFAILARSRTFKGEPLKIIRLPAGPTMTKKVEYRSLGKEEKSWFENVSSDSVEFYLTTGYMNFIIANDVVVTAKFWKEGLPEEIRHLDQEARNILQSAFPNRRIAQVDCLPLHHDGAGLHCHSRNQPQAGKR